jgi:hypothetical protein
VEERHEFWSWPLAMAPELSLRPQEEVAAAATEQLGHYDGADCEPWAGHHLDYAS